MMPQARLSLPHTIKRNYLLIIIATVLLTASFTAPGQTREEYAQATGSACAVCHLDPLGGGALSQTGEGYALSIAPGVPRSQPPRNLFSHFFRLVIGYLHIITAFMWFGTILYVHLVLKPAYASQGLPRGEVKVGLASMVIMAVTGAILTHYKVPTFSLLFSSPFGLLLLAKIVIFSIMVLSAIFVVLVIGPRLKAKKVLNPAKSGVLTLAELGGFDGEADRPAYFAYRGLVYDVTASNRWRHGRHMNRHQAGIDLTDTLSQAPHDEDKILAMPLVGRLSGEKGNDPAELHKKVFYFMAYMNLVFVFVIALILALWRWA